MALGYQIGFVCKRTSRVFKTDNNVTITLDQLGTQSFIQIKGPEREAVAAIGDKLNLAGSYDPRSYIEMVKDDKSLSLSGKGSAELCDVLSRVERGDITPTTSPLLRPVSASRDRSNSDVSFTLVDDESSGLLKNRLEIVQAGDEYRIKKLHDLVSFDKGLFLCFKAMQLLRRMNPGRVLIVGVAGASGSGKSSFASKLTSLLDGLVVVTMDNYMMREEVVDDNFDDPRLVDFDLLAQNLKDLKAGRPTEMPIYSFQESRRVGYSSLAPPASGVVVIEGIHALNEQARHYLDIAVSISGGVHFDLVKRVIRDIVRVGQRGSEVINQVTETVYPMYKAFIEPGLEFAHIKIRNAFNPFDGFTNPVYILKSPRSPTAEQIKAVLGNADTELETYTDIYLHPPGTKADDTVDWIRMREHGKKYNLMFSEWLREGDFIICPRIDFEVNVKVLGGLMALGYQIGFVMARTSRVFTGENATVSLDELSGHSFIQIKGTSRDAVAAVGEKLGLCGHYDPRSYIEMVKQNNLVAVDETELNRILSSAAQRPPKFLSNSASKDKQTPRDKTPRDKTPRDGTSVRTSPTLPTDPAALAAEVMLLREHLVQERSARQALEQRLSVMEDMRREQQAMARQLDLLVTHLVPRETNR